MFEARAAVRSSLALAVLALLALSAACGQKGPLYLPKKTKTVITPAAPAPSSSPGPASPEIPAPAPAAAVKAGDSQPAPAK